MRGDAGTRGSAFPMRRSTETGGCLRCEEAVGAGTVETERGKLLTGGRRLAQRRACGISWRTPAAALPLAIPWRQPFILEKRGLLAILL